MVATKRTRSSSRTASPSVVLFFKRGCVYCERFRPYAAIASHLLAAAGVSFQSIDEVELAMRVRQHDPIGGSIIRFPTLRVVWRNKGGRIIGRGVDWKNADAKKFVASVPLKQQQTTILLCGTHPNYLVRQNFNILSHEAGGVEKLTALLTFLESAISRK